MDEIRHKTFKRLNDDFDFLLEKFRQVSELYDHIIRYDGETQYLRYSLDDETLSQICCEYLSSNITYHFIKRESHIKEVKEINDTNQKKDKK